MSKLDDLLKQLGLDLQYEDLESDTPGSSDKTIFAKIHDPNDLTKSAHIPFSVTDEYKHLKTIDPLSTYLPKEWQKKGITSALYKEMEDRTGGKMVPGVDQSPASFGLHDKSGFGKQFGIKDSTLNKLLTPEELAERNIRKESLGSRLSKLAEMISKEQNTDALGSDGMDLDYDRKILGKTDPKNIGSLFDNVLSKAKNFPTGKEAGEFITKNLPSTLGKVRSLAPILGKVALGAGTAGFSLASEAADSETVGDVNEDRLERGRVDQENQQKQIESSTSVPDHVKLKALELFKKNRLPY